MKHQLLTPGISHNDALISQYLDNDASGRDRYTYVDAWPSALDELATLAELAPATGAPTGGPSARGFVEALHADPDAERSMTRFAVFPWRRSLVRIPYKPLWDLLHTSRNNHLVDWQQQQKWATTPIGIAGLSVGSAALQSAVMTGAATFRLTDTDTLSLSNLNRVERSVCDLGQSKLELAARYAYESNPYVAIDKLPAGYQDECSGDFIGAGDVGPGAQLGVIVEEMDDVALKISLRQRARDAGVPVVSATDMGNNVVVDVERFDIDKSYPVLHGRVEGITLDNLHSDPIARVRAAFAVVGDVATPAMLHSATQVGRSLPSWPQLGSTAMTAGGLAATVARLVVTGYAVESGRYVFDLEGQLLGPEGERPRRWNELPREGFLRLVAPS